jgi:hypothetical protein
MREIRTSGSEGGGALIRSPYPYRLDLRLLLIGRVALKQALGICR